MAIYKWSIVFMAMMSFISLTDCRRIVRYANIAVLTLLLIFNANDFDYDAYVTGYENPEIYSKTMELGYRYMCALLRLIGFNDFRIVLVILSVILIYTLIRVLKDDIDQLNIVLLVFFTFAFVYFVIQIRNSFMLLFIINYAYSIYEKKYKRAIVEGAVSIGFHTMAAGYLIAFTCLYLLFKSNENQFKMISFGNGLFLLAVYIIGKFYPIIINYIGNNSNYLISYKYNIYMQEFEGISIWVPVTIIDLCLFYILGIRKVKDNHIKQKTNIIYLFLLIELPALFFLRNFNEIGRLYRDMFLIKGILCASLSSEITKGETILLYAYSLLSSLVIVLSIGIDLDSVFKIVV